MNVVLTEDQVHVIRTMMDECREKEDPNDIHRLFLLLEYLFSFGR